MGWVSCMRACKPEGYLSRPGSCNLVGITSLSPFIRFALPTTSFVAMFFPTLRAPFVALGAYAAGVLAVPAVSDTTHDREWILFLLGGHLLKE